MDARIARSGSIQTVQASTSSTSAGFRMSSGSRPCAAVAEAATAIRDMWVRGAPLIGATAAYGLALAMREDPSDAALDAAYDKLAATRPTAINLRWALDCGRKHLAPLAPKARAAAAYAEAKRVADEDVEINRAIGAHGLEIVRRLAAGKKPGRAGQHPHPLQRGLVGDGRLRHGDRAHLSGDGGRRERPRLCGRDAPAQSGRLPDSLGARASRRRRTRSSSTMRAGTSCSMGSSTW